MTDPTTEIYSAIGDAPLYALAAAFYREVEREPLLRRLYPDDLTDAEQHLALFFVQRFGGPSVYGEQRGHPRLRLRHMPFAIGQAEHDAWLACIGRAMDAAPVLAPFRAALDKYFADAAAFLINKAEAQPGNETGGTISLTLPPADPPR